ncbi:MAG: GspE/PulE family protein [Candidatus Peregrinibacteria bacterium]|nr:GspE/PulE family protein [Candidatus Peregrinibacteria bacterium]
MIDNAKFQQLKEAIIAGNIPQLALMMISLALDMRASDIHIEPEEKLIRIRYRIDGSLQKIVEYPPNIHPAVISRIKIMSNLKIDEQRIPQDGRCQVTSKDNREMDLRVSTFPTVNGEKVVMRIQDKSRKIPDVTEIGLDGNNYTYLMEGLDSPNGIILTSGPTGSGKTTTLYTCLNKINTEDVNILTIEDPVEIQMDGLSQSQVHHDIQYDFAMGMRAALRQDPDIIMVGEIRDHETVDIAIEASLTGHLVLSTIHTNSAVETLTRIENMDIPEFLVASTIEVIIAQRLVRKLCQSCKQPAPIDTGTDTNASASALRAQIDKALAGGVEAKFPQMDKALLAGKAFFVPKGCDQCNNIGYFGRIAIYEVLRMNNEIRRLILEKAPSVQIEKAAIKLGMITLEQDGLVKCLKGITSLEEVYAVARKVEEYV